MFRHLTDEEQIVRKRLKLRDPKEFYRQKLRSNLDNPRIDERDLTRQLGYTTMMLIRAVTTALLGKTVCLIGANDRMDKDLMRLFQMMMIEVGADWIKLIVPNNASNRQKMSVIKFVDHTVMESSGRQRMINYAKEGWL